MTLDTPTHLELLHGYAIPPTVVRHEVQLLGLLDRTVTALTCDASRDMAVVPKLDMLGETVDLLPGNRTCLPRIAFQRGEAAVLFHEFDSPVLLQRTDSLELVVLWRELSVTAHTQLDRRNARHARAIGPRVAVLTVDAEPTGVMLVTEWNRLLRAGRRRIRGDCVRFASRQRRPRLVELGWNLDLKLGIVAFHRLELLRFTDTARTKQVIAGLGTV